MTPPPPQAYLIGAGIAWNVTASIAGYPTISRWACQHKKVAVPIAVGFGTWLAWHFATYELS